MEIGRVLIFAVLLCIFTMQVCVAKKKVKKSMVLREKETNPINFIRLAVMRLVYGIATRIGFGEEISEALNGAFLPPGVDDYDYGDGGLGFFEREDDYDY
ncbi:uncharacterized protein LOC123320823 [Coccinella septempunctata]|uniref:uncharacterized protein LOC123320823 n=1 Tax=Coccinella septempunctata TaxID=41139 RepID=UPI001D079616|nr:uncharacterized protein LOC123320823 [Coccinella septempunctata]